MWGLRKNNYKFMQHLPYQVITVSVKDSDILELRTFKSSELCGCRVLHNKVMRCLRASRILLIAFTSYFSLVVFQHLLVFVCSEHFLDHSHHTNCRLWCLHLWLTQDSWFQNRICVSSWGEKI